MGDVQLRKVLHPRRLCVGPAVGIRALSGWAAPRPRHNVMGPRHGRKLPGVWVSCQQGQEREQQGILLTRNVGSCLQPFLSCLG